MPTITLYYPGNSKGALVNAQINCAKCGALVWVVQEGIKFEKCHNCHADLNHPSLTTD